MSKTCQTCHVSEKHKDSEHKTKIPKIAKIAKIPDISSPTSTAMPGMVSERVGSVEFRPSITFVAGPTCAEK